MTLLVLAALAQAALGVPVELLSLVMLAPALACTVVLLRPSWMPTPWKRVRGLQVLSAAGISVVAVVVFFAVLAVVTASAPRWSAETGGATVVLFVALQALGALAEEVGWRGVVQRCGETFARPAVVSAGAGFLFGATHLGYWGLGVVPVLTFALTAMCMSLTITTIFIGAFWQRMIPALVVHLGLNLSLTMLPTDEAPLATGPAALGAAAAMLLVAVATKRYVVSR